MDRELLPGELPPDMVHVFDYGSINADHQEAAKEICELIKHSGNPILADAIAERFKLVQPVRFDYTTTDFAAACAQAGVNLTVQGFVVDHSDPEKKQYPIVSISEDIRLLQSLVDVLKG
jgi:hypothetical protein